MTTRRSDLQGELPLPEPTPVRLLGARKKALETGRNRILVTAVMFTLMFAVVAARLVDLTVIDKSDTPDRAPQLAATDTADEVPVVQRADIVDRNGVLLATSLPTASLFANPRQVLDPAEAARRLVKVLPDLDESWVRGRLSSSSSFVWLRRTLTPRQQYAVNRLGIPGLHFRAEDHRVYPLGREAAQVLGFTDVDGHGIAGLEREFDSQLNGGSHPLRTTLDIRVQSALRQELARAVDEYKALGAAGLVLDVTNGQVLAMVSLPDFDPNDPSESVGEAGFNRVTKGVYEMGSTFKLLTAAMALDAGTVSIDGGYDASKPIHVARFTISDYHAQNRWLSVPEILIHSSNIGAAKMAMALGTNAQRRYLDRLGMLTPSTIQLPEVGTPLYPTHWREINTMTISYGHGIAVSPLQISVAVAAIADGGMLHPATLIMGKEGAMPARRVVSEKTSLEMRRLMRLVVEKGTGRKADVPGFSVGGKTGSAEKQQGNGYRQHALISSFIGVFPTDAPRYLVLALLDEPHGDKKTYGFATAGWVAAPVVAQMVAHMAPLLDIRPQPADSVGIQAEQVALRGILQNAKEGRLAAN